MMQSLKSFAPSSWFGLLFVLVFLWLLIGDSILGPVVQMKFQVVDGSPASVVRGEQIKFLSVYDRLRSCATHWIINLQNVTTERRYLIPDSAHLSANSEITGGEFEQTYDVPYDIPPGWYIAINTGTHRCMVFRKVETFPSQEFEVL